MREIINAMLGLEGDEKITTYAGKNEKAYEHAHSPVRTLAAVFFLAEKSKGTVHTSPLAVTRRSRSVNGTDETAGLPNWEVVLKKHTNMPAAHRGTGRMFTPHPPAP